MKTSLALQPRRPLNRAEAWGCLTANLAMPGSGSLVAGRKVGYAQLVFTGIGLCITMTSGLRFISWYFKNWSQYSDRMADPWDALAALWQQLRWPLIGFSIFLIALLWALATSLRIIRENRENSLVPPKLTS